MSGCKRLMLEQSTSNVIAKGGMIIKREGSVDGRMRDDGKSGWMMQG